MNILVDTAIWSLSLRRRTANLNPTEDRLVAECSALIRANRACLIGPIRQELLSGIRRVESFDLIRRQISRFELYPVTTEDYDRAAEFFNVCQVRGVAGSDIDMLIGAVAHRNLLPICTTGSRLRSIWEVSSHYTSPTARNYRLRMGIEIPWSLSVC